MSSAAFGAAHALPHPAATAAPAQRCHRRGAVVALRRGIVRTRAIPAPDDEGERQRAAEEQRRAAAAGVAAEAARKTGRKLAEGAEEVGAGDGARGADVGRKAPVGDGIAGTAGRRDETPVRGAATERVGRAAKVRAKKPAKVEEKAATTSKARSKTPKLVAEASVDASAGGRLDPAKLPVATGKQRIRAVRKTVKATKAARESARDSVTASLQTEDSTKLQKDTVDASANAAKSSFSTRRAEVAPSPGGSETSGESTDGNHRGAGHGRPDSWSEEDLNESHSLDLASLKPVRRTGFNSPVVMTPELAKLLKTQERVMTRPQVASLVADYVGAKKLACADDGRFFAPNPALKRLFPEQTGRVQISKLVAYIRPHVVLPSDCGDEALVEQAMALWDEYVQSIPLSSRIRKVDRRGRGSAAFQSKMRAAGRGLYAPCELSAALSKICDGESMLSRPEVTKCVWRHIKNLGLQDGNERRIVHTDPLLKEVCGGNVDSVDCFELSKYIARNLTVTA